MSATCAYLCINKMQKIVIVIKKPISMRRIVYILSVLLFFSCQKESQGEADVQAPVVEFTFGEVSVATRETEAEIEADLPYVQIDGKFDHDAQLTLLYQKVDSLDNDYSEIYAFEYTLGKVKFLIRNLESETTYRAFLQLESSTGEVGASESFELTTYPDVSTN